MTLPIKEGEPTPVQTMTMITFTYLRERLEQSRDKRNTMMGGLGGAALCCSRFTTFRCRD